MTNKTIINNKKARFNYEILEEVDAGIILLGSEVKSIKIGKVNISDSYIEYSKNNELFLVNCHISKYPFSNNLNHEIDRPRKLLLHKKEINKISGKVKIKGMSLVPLRIFLNKRNIIKVQIALAKGKKIYDKKRSIREREDKIKIRKEMINNGNDD